MTASELSQWRAAVAARWSTLRSSQVITAGVALTVTVVVAQTIGQLIDFRLFQLKLTALDSDHHASVFGALSVFAQGLAAAAIGWRAVSSGRRPAGLSVGLLAVLVVVRTLMRYEAFVRYEVPILVAPLTLIVVVLGSLTFRAEARARYLVWASLLLLGCSFALHAVGLQADAGKAYAAMHSWAYQVTGMLKHSAELAGWMLLATGMAAICRAQGAHGRIVV